MQRECQLLNNGPCYYCLEVFITLYGSDCDEVVSVVVSSATKSTNITSDVALNVSCRLLFTQFNGVTCDVTQQRDH